MPPPAGARGARAIPDDERRPGPADATGITTDLRPRPI